MEQRGFELLKRYSKGLCTEEEKTIVEQWYAEWNRKDRVYLTEETLITVEENMRKNISGQISHKTKKLWPMQIAAAVAICLSVLTYFVIHKSQEQQMAAVKVKPIVPGGNRAILTIGNGQKITLNDAHTGKIATQGNIAISKVADGQVIYRRNEKSGVLSPSVTNTLSTPRGGKYDLTLVDGTRVWLDASSSITYPTVFNGNVRTVNITGQVYFEVAHNSAKPFHVIGGGQDIEVLGTHFNVMAYPEEGEIKTTLLEGSVKVGNGKLFKVLKPGQQSLASPDEITLAKQVNLEAVMAWKNGYFMFGGEDIKTIMRKISRWYDVEVVFTGAVPTDKFSGTVNRFAEVSEVLKNLELTNAVHFKIEGRRILVSK